MAIFLLSDQSSVMKTLSIEVRRAEAHDAGALTEVHRTAWLHAYAGLIPHKPLNQMVERRREGWWKKATHGPSTLLVVDVAGKIAGYASIGHNRARTLPQEGEIYEIYLLPQYQGIGLGSLLFREARTYLGQLGMRGLVAWCLEDSEQADQFFRATGGVDHAEGMEDFDGRALKKIGFVWSH